MNTTLRGAQWGARPAPRGPGVSPLMATGVILAGILIGVVSARSAVAAIALPMAFVFVVAAFRDLAIGVSLFTMLAFFQLIPGFGGSSITLVKAAGLVLAAAWFVALVDKRGGIRFLPRDHIVVGVGAVAFWLWGASSAIWAINVSDVETYLSRIGQGVLLFLIMYSALREPKYLRLFVWVFVFGGFVAGALGLVYTAHDSGDRLGSLAISDPNYLAAALIPTLVLAAFLFMSSHTPLARIALAVMSGVTAVSLFMTQSRGGVIGLGAVIVAAVLLSGPARLRMLIAVLLIVASGLTYYGVFASQEARDRITNFSPQASSGRSDLWTVALREFHAHPLAGVGGGNFVVAKAAYATENVNLTRLDRVVDDPVVTHNTYFEILAELGLTGIFLFGLMVVGVLTIGMRGIWRLERLGFADTALLDTRAPGRDDRDARRVHVPVGPVREEPLAAARRDRCDLVHRPPRLDGAVPVPAPTRPVRALARAGR